MTTAPPRTSPEAMDIPRRPRSIEETCFVSAMICLEGHFTKQPPTGPLSMNYVTKFLARTLDKTHNLKAVREELARSVEVWLWLTRIFSVALPSLSLRSVGPPPSPRDPEKQVAPPPDCTDLIVKHYATLKDDLQTLNKLMHIARNMLVTPEPEIPQDLCAAVLFDQMVYEAIVLCINVTSKGYGEILDDTSRVRLTEITEMYKKLLVTSLQQAHNWTAKNDRNKMSLWHNMLFDEEAPIDEQDLGYPPPDFRADVARTEVLNWIKRNSSICSKARELLIQWEKIQASRGPPGHLTTISPLAWNWMPNGDAKSLADKPEDKTKITPIWNKDEPDKFKQDRAYGRVSREIDMWWRNVRDPNYEAWVVPMPSVEFAQQRTESCKANLAHRYSHIYRAEEEHDQSPESTEEESSTQDEAAAADEASEGPSSSNSQQQLGPEDYLLDEEEDMDDDESYGEGPMGGMLTEVPNILDPKQIEALHMIVKSCILDNAGMGLTRAGENLQKTRCRMFLAVECGRSLLREMLVYIAVWEKTETSLIFQITTQIVEAIHHSALIAHAWQSLRIPKDIISPAQTILLRLITHMFRARNTDRPAGAGIRDDSRDIKLLYFLFTQFRTRIVPECLALMHMQAQMNDPSVPSHLYDPADFPVDSWDMERAKDGLQQFLDLLTTVNESIDMRNQIIKWEGVYELLALLKGLEAGVPKKPLVEMPRRPAQRQQGEVAAVAQTSDPVMVPAPHPATTSAFREEEEEEEDMEDEERIEEEDTDDEDGSVDGYLRPPPPPPPPPPIQESAHDFPWAGIKGQILCILAGLLQPPAGRSGPGNPNVQMQIMRHNGLVSLLNCCVYDDHNRFARERVQLCLKWLMDGCQPANTFLTDMVAAMGERQPGHNAGSAAGPSSAGAPPYSARLRIDGIGGEVKVQVRSPRAPAAVPQPSGGGGGENLPSLASSTAIGSGIDVEGTTLPPIQPSATLGASASKDKPSGQPDTTRSEATINPAEALARMRRPEELLKDIITLATEAAQLTLDGEIYIEEVRPDDGTRDRSGHLKGADRQDIGDVDFM